MMRDKSEQEKCRVNCGIYIACVGISSQAAVRKIDAMKSCLTCKRVFSLPSAHLTSKCRYYEGRIKVSG